VMPSKDVVIDARMSLYAKGIDVLGSIGRANMRVMSGTDEFFKFIQNAGELRALARRQAYGEGLRGEELLARQAELIADPSKSLLDQAQAFARAQTFTKEFTGATAKAAQGLANTTPMRL